MAIKKKDEFFDYIETLKENYILQEKDYGLLISLIKKVSLGNKNYLFIGDLRSRKDMKIAKKFLETIQFMDNNLENLDSLSLRMIVEKLYEIENLSNDIKELVKVCNADSKKQQ